MLLIIEGPDGAGKSTLINKFKDAKYFHFTVPKPGEDQGKMYVEAMLKASESDLAVFDRCWYSDSVYAPVMRGTPGLSQESRTRLENIAEAICDNVLVIYCTAPVDVLWERCCERGETYIPSKEKLQEICDHYSKVMSTVGLPLVVYDTSKKYWE